MTIQLDPRQAKTLAGEDAKKAKEERIALIKEDLESKRALMLDREEAAKLDKERADAPTRNGSCPWRRRC